MTLNIDQVAAELETDPRTARRFLRDVVPGHDYRHKWEIKVGDMPELKLLFLVRELGLTRAIDALTSVRHGGSIAS